MDSKIIKVLLIEDNSVEAMMIKGILSKTAHPSFFVEWRENLKSGIERLAKKDVDIVLLDLLLPDSEGIHSFREVYKEVPEVPVIVLTNVDDENLALEALREGAQDYVVKGEIDSRMLWRIICYSIERKKIELQLKNANDRLAQNEKALVEMLESLRRSNRELRMIRLQLIQAEKMEVVGRLAAGVAHEVKNPLAMLRMGLDYFSQDIKPADQKGVFMLQSMEAAIQKADMVIKEVLDFSSVQELDMQPHRLEGVIDQALILIKHELDKHQVKIIKEIEPNLPLIKLDHNRIEQVLVNLFTNAIQAMKKQGDLKIFAQSKKLETIGNMVGYRKDDIFSPGDVVAVLIIEDTGPGIPQDCIGKVFDPFFTTKRSEGGAGLGLTIVKNIIQMHHGYIEVENKETGGVKVTIMLRIS